MNDGDWVEGEPQWWWKYVFPSREQLWVSVLQNGIIKGGAVSGPFPEPWREAATEILEGLAMLHATARLDDADVSQRLRLEAAEKIGRAAEKVKG